MPRAHVEKALYFIVNFIRQTTLRHKKKLATLVVITLLTYIAKRKLRITHLLTLAEHLTRILSYLPLPEFPTYRQLNRYESPQLNTLSQQIIQNLKVDALTLGIRQKTNTWQQLKTIIFAGTLLSLALFNVQSFYFVVQNKYEKDFVQLQAVEVFDQLMGGIRKRFLLQIATIMDSLVCLLSDIISSINVKQEVSIDDIFHLIDSMLQTVFAKKFLLKKSPNEHINKSIYKNEEAYDIAKNYFTTALNYIPKKKSSFSKFASRISSISSRFSFSLFKKPICQTSLQRFDWIKTAYQIPLKKFNTDELKWPNRQSQLLSKLVMAEMDQVLTSINFSTVVYENSQYNLTVLKNRLFLYFSKKGIKKLKIAEALPVIYKLLKEELLVSGPHMSLKRGQEDKRTRFYESQIIKAIRHKCLGSAGEKDSQAQLLIRPQLNMEVESENVQQQAANPQLILLNMNLQQIYESRQLGHLVREFEIKYFNERSGVTLNPMQRKSNDDDEMKKLLSMLSDNKELNSKEDDRQQKR